MRTKINVRLLKLPVVYGTPTANDAWFSFRRMYWTCACGQVCPKTFSTLIKSPKLTGPLETGVSPMSSRLTSEKSIVFECHMRWQKRTRGQNILLRSRGLTEQNSFLKRMVTGDKWIMYDNGVQKQSKGQAAQKVSKPKLTLGRFCAPGEPERREELFPYGLTLSSNLYCRRL